MNNKELYAAMKVYLIECEECEKEGKPIPPVPHFVGESIMKIATHFAHKPNFINYKFREEMISDGIENCLQYIHNFNWRKYNNPFAYFTQTIFRAFLRRIDKEKRYLYTKHVATELAEVQQITAETQASDHRNYKPDPTQTEWAETRMREFMEHFESTRRKRRKKKVANEDVKE